MKSVKIKTIIEGDGNTTGIPVPEDVVLGFGVGRRVPLKVTVGNTTYQSSVSFYKGEYLISLSADNRAKAGVAAGDQVEAELELDTAPRDVELPEDIKKLLAADPVASANYKKLSFSKKRAIIEPITQAKTPETRQRRIEKALASLR